MQEGVLTLSGSGTNLRAEGRHLIAEDGIATIGGGSAGLA